MALLPIAAPVALVERPFPAPARQAVLDVGELAGTARFPHNAVDLVHHVHKVDGLHLVNVDHFGSSGIGGCPMYSFAHLSSSAARPFALPASAPVTPAHSSDMSPKVSILARMANWRRSGTSCRASISRSPASASRETDVSKSEEMVGLISARVTRGLALTSLVRMCCGLASKTLNSSSRSFGTRAGVMFISIPPHRRHGDRGRQDGPTAFCPVQRGSCSPRTP